MEGTWTGPVVRAACGHDLKGTPVAEDGCTVCPECGAAWRMPERAPSASRG